VLRPTANTGYQFLRWADGNIDNPRTVTVVQDTTLTAVFGNGSLPILTVTVRSNVTQGLVTGGSRYTSGEQAVIRAIPNVGYRFVRWTDGNGDNPRTITVTGNMTFTAEFVAEMYTLTVNSNNSGWGTVAVNPVGPYTLNQQVVLTPNAVNGYRFVKWNDNTTDNPRTITVTGDLTVSAEFTVEIEEIEMYTLTVNSNDENRGRVTVAPAGPYTLNQQVVLTPNAATGSHFVKWNDNITDNPRIVTVTSNMTFTAEFVAEMYTLTVNSSNSDWGTVAVNPVGPYTLNQQVVLTPNAVNGYRFAKWNDNTTDNPRTITVTGNMTVSAEFTVEMYTLTVNSNDENRGRVTVAPAGPYTLNQQVVLTPNAVTGSRFVKWDDNITDNPRIVTVTSNMTFTAEFAANAEICTLTVNSNNDTWGTVAVNPAGPYTQGQQVVLTPNPANGYRFVKWNDDNTDNPRTITVTGDMTFTAEFFERKYTLTVNSNDENWGTVTVAPTGTYTYGQQVVLTANTVNSYYHFVKWNDDITDNPRTITVTRDTTLTAVFATNAGTTYTLTVTSNYENRGTVTVNPASPYTYGQSVTLTAAAVNGYRFVKWADNVTVNPRTITVIGNMTFTAEFEQITGTITGNGSEADPYRISSKTDMEQLATAVNGGQNYSGVYFRLTCDLTGADDILTTSVGNSNTTYFSGIFDGDGHKIAVNTTGVFGRIRNATIKNLGVTGRINTYSSYPDNYYYAGGICATTENSTINNCYNNAEITISAGSDLAQMNSGGICGQSTNSNISNCYNTGSIYSTGNAPSSAGGIIGRYESGGAIINCYNTGSISVAGYEPSSAGGITGRSEGGGTLTNCYNTGSISATAFFQPYSGGITGAGGTITNCYNTGSISAFSYSIPAYPAYCGGINGAGGTITNCYNTGSISATASADSYSGGICGSGGTVRNCFVANMQITTNDIPLTYTGRIGGNDDGNYADCYADGVSVNGNPISGTDKNGKNGLDATLADLQSLSWLTATLGWDFTYNWSMTSAWPELKKVQPFAVRGAVSKSSAGMGSVNPSDTIAVTGEQVVFTATPATGYQFVQWQEDGNKENPRTVTIIGDMTFTAEFGAKSNPGTTYTLTVTSNDDNWGTVTVNPAGPYTLNQQVVLTANPVNGCQFRRWNDDVTVNPRTITVTGDMNLKAEFAVDPTVHYALTVGSNNENWGMVTVNPADPYTYGQQVVLTAAAVNGYRFVKWNDNVTVNPRTIAVIGNMTFEAEFAVDPTATFTLTVNSNNANWGAVTINPAGPYTYGRQVVLTATAVNGYRFAKWSDNSTVNPRTVTVTGDMTITAEFAVDPTATYTLTVNSNYENRGAVTINPAGPYMLNQQVVLTATAVSGYRFAKWSDNSTVNPRTVTVTGNMTFTAEFAAVPTYLITVRASNTNWGTVDGEGRYSEYEEVEITAIPKSGYHFDQWLDKNTDNPRLITVTANATYIAVFAEGSDDTSEIPTPFDPTVVIYPNPVRDVLYIRSAVAIEQVVIRDLSGQQVKQIASPVGREIDVSDLAAGVYLVGITTTAGETIRKIVISD
jgi:NOL1/NOP2/fmu family ribosome biogenesis protein